MPSSTSSRDSGLLCRASSVAALSKFFAASASASSSFPLPPCVVVSGPPQCGKTSLVSSVLDSLPHLRAAFASCQQGTVHSRLIFECLLCQLLGLDRCSGKDFSSPVRCNNLGEFVERLTTDANKILGDDASGIVLVLRNAERLRELEANLLPGFLRLQELTCVNVCVILVSRVSFNKYLSPSGLPRPYFVQLRPYTREELTAIVASKLRSADRDPIEPEFYRGYANLILSFSVSTSNSLPQLLWLASRHFPLYRRPVALGEVEADDVRALYRRIERPLRESLGIGAAHFRESENRRATMAALQAGGSPAAGASPAAAVAQAPGSYAQRRLHVELPFHSKFLLIAAYLASYNPEQTDKRFFLKHHGKQRKTVRSLAAKASRQSLHVLGPKAFPLDRLLAIFYSIVEEDVVPSVNVLSQIATLVTLQFVLQVSSDDALDQPKYKCVVDLDFITQIAKQVDFEIRRYLYDFV